MGILRWLLNLLLLLWLCMLVLSPFQLLETLGAHYKAFRMACLFTEPTFCVAFSFCLESHLEILDWMILYANIIIRNPSHIEILGSNPVRCLVTISKFLEFWITYILFSGHNNLPSLLKYTAHFKSQSFMTDCFITLDSTNSGQTKEIQKKILVIHQINFEFSWFSVRLLEPLH